MPIDWLAALGTQDQSLEAQLARRDLSKKMALLADIQNQVEQRRIADERTQVERDQIAAQEKYRQTQQDALNRERETDNKRAVYSSISSGRKPGDKVGKQALDVIAEFEGGTGDYSADPNDPLQFIYKQAEAQALLDKAKRDETIRLAQEERAKEDQKLQRESADRARKEEERRNQREERAKQRHTAEMAKLQKQADTEVPVHLRQQFNKLVEDEIKKNAPAWYDIFSEAQGREDAVRTALDKIKQLTPGAIRIPPTGGRGAGSGRGAAQTTPTNEEAAYLSPEEVAQKFPQLPPGAKVRRVQ